MAGIQIKGIKNKLRELKYEFRCINLRLCIICAAVMSALGIFSAFICGGFYIYRIILLPKLAPPAFVYIIVWTVMYILLGAALAFVLSNRQRHCAGERGRGIVIFITMTLFNIIWCPLFFGAGSFFLSLVDALIIMLLSVFCLKYFVNVSVTAALLMFIHVIWLLFCIWINLGILFIN